MVRMDDDEPGEFRRGGVEYLNWIRQKIHESDPQPEDKYRFVFRELVQNADDAGADKLVVRFRPEALEVANDGHPFREGEVDDFDRILGVLQHHKKGDPEKLGEFGSGFQTVFRVTNRPVVISNGKKLTIDPVRPVEKRGHDVDLPVDDDEGSPYGQEGALFRLPWRTEETVADAQARAKREGTDEEGEPPFEDETWTRWNTDERRAMYEELTEYAHSLLLCTTSVKEIRILWEQGEKEGYRVRKDFTCVGEERPTAESIVERGTVVEESGEGGWERWTTTGEEERYEYLVAHRNCTDDERRFQWVVDSEEGVRIETSREEPDDHVKKNDVWLLLPLFPEEDLDRGYRFSYTMIPLTSRTGNHFVTSAHLFPTQDRKNVDRGSRGGTAGAWADIVKENARDLYEDVFPRFVASVHQLDTERSRKQRILMDALPASEADQWIHPVGSAEKEGTVGVDILDLMEKISQQPIVATLEGWEAPADSLWSPSLEVPEILRRVDIPHLPTSVIEHSHSERLDHAESVEESKLTPPVFETLWSEGDDSVIDRFGTAGILEYGAPLARGSFDEEYARLLVEFAILGEEAHPRYRTIPLVPSRDGDAKRLASLKAPPEGHEELVDIVPDEERPHDDVEDLVPDENLDPADVSSLLQGLSAKQELGPQETLDLVQELYTYVEEVQEADDLSLPPPEQLRTVGWSFVPTRDGHLRPPAEISYAPAEHYDSSVELFEENDVGTEWVHPDIIAGHEELLQRLGVPRPPYVELTQELDGDSRDLTPTERRVLLEGVTASLDRPESSEVRFLASGDRLLPPVEALLGGTGDRDLDRYLGVIDEDLQSYVQEQEREPYLKNAGVRTTDPLTVLKKIDEMNEEDTSRFEAMTEEDHKGITSALRYCCEEGWSLSMAMDSMTVLPYRQGGDVSLGLVRSQLDGTAGHFGENYKRDWIFAPGEGLDYLPEDVENQVKVLDLHPEGEAELKEVRQRFKLVGLSLANLVRHFVADYKTQESLFRQGPYEEFVPDSSQAGFDELRRELLEAVPEYFGSVKDEITPQKMKEVPLLYDEEEEWAPTKEFTLETDVEVELFGMRDLHPDFSDWPDITLEAIGVTSNPDPSVVLDRIKEFAEEGDLHGLENALQLLLTSDREYPDDGAIYHDLRDRVWVPTRGGEIVEPDEAILPTKENEDALGDDYARLASVVDPLDWSKSTVKNRASRLKLLEDPPLEALSEVLMERASEGERPPKDLFEAFSDRIESPEDIDEGRGYRYHDGTGWYHPEDVYLRDLPYLPDQLRRDIVVDPRDDHIPFLRAIGAKTEPTVRDLVTWLEDLPDEQDTDPLFAKLVDRRDDIPPDGPERYGDIAIQVPSVGTRMAPNRTVLLPRSTTLHGPLEVGTWTFVSEDGIPDPHEVCIRALGAGDLQELATERLLRIQSGLEPVPEHLAINRQLLEELVDQDGADGSVKVPIHSEGRWELAPVAETIFPDDPTARLLGDDADLVSTSHVPSPDDFLPWAKARGLDRLSEIIDIEPQGWSWDDAEVDRTQEDRLAALSTAMGEILRRRGLDGREEVGWLKDATVRRRNSLPVEVKGDGFDEAQLIGCIHRESPDGVDLYVPVRGPPSFLRDVAHTIVSLTEQKEGVQLGPEDEQDVIQTVQTLLGTKPSRWNRVTDLDVEGPPVDPLMEIREEWGDERYYRIRSTLSSWYDACQICSLATPRGPNTTETMEKVRSVISERGGPYTGERSSNVSNALWLCPRHSALYERSLVKILPLEDGSLDQVQKLRANLTKRLEGSYEEDDIVELPDLVEVRSHRYNEETGQREEHVEDDIVFHLGHLRGMLDEWEAFLVAGGNDR
jgi:hypothetical protein